MTGVPQGWVQTQLGRLGHYINGRAFKSTEWGQKGRPIIRIQNLTGSSERTNRYDGYVEPQYIVEPEDLLVSWSATLGAYFWHGPQGVLNQHIFRVDSHINKRFHKYLLDHVLSALMAKTHGSGMVHITRKPFDEQPVLLPPLAEQGRIAAAVEEQFSRLDAAVVALERIRTNLKRMRSATLHAAVTGSLFATADDSLPFEILESDEPLEANMSSENARKVNRAKADLINRTWPVPPSWRWLSAAEVCEVVASGSTPAAKAMTAGHGEVPFIKVYNLTNRGVLDFSVRPTFISHATHTGRLNRSRLQPGDILTNIVGPPLGKVAIVPGDYPEWNTNQAVVVFRPIRSLHPLLLKYWLLSPPVLSLLESTSRATAGQFNVSLTTCRALPLPIPPQAEQKVIVDSIEEHLSRIEAQEQVTAAALIRTAHLRSAILAAAFSGKLVPQDPYDEPASVLLERMASLRPSNGHNTARPLKQRTTAAKVLA